MLGCPLPPFPAGLGKAPSLFHMAVVVVASHINAVLLYIIAMVAEAIDILLPHLHACLHELVILVVAHGKRGIEGTCHKQVDVLCEAHPLVVEVVPIAHADGQLSEVHAPDAHASAFLRQWVFAASRDDDHGVVHRCLQNIDQWDAAVHYLQSLTELQSRGLTFVLAQTTHGRLCS